VADSRSRDRVFGALGRAFDSVLTAGGYVCAVLAVFVTCLLVYEVFTRYLLKRPSMWSLDTATYALLYLALIGAPWLLREDGHVKIEIMTANFSKRTQAITTAVTSLVAAISCGIFCWQSSAITWEAYRAGHFIERAVVVPRSLLIWVMAFGSFLLFIQFIRRACEHFRIFLHIKSEGSHES